VELRTRADDGVELEGDLSIPGGEGPFACAVALHAAAFGERSHPLYEHLRATLDAIGVAVVRYDRRGAGRSGGSAEVPLSRLAADGSAVVREAARHPSIDPERVGVWGISQGGWIGPLAADADPGIAFVVAVSASGASPSVQMHFAMANVLRERGFDDHDLAAAHEARRSIEEPYRARDVEAAVAALRAVEHEAWFPFAYLPTAEDIAEPFEIDLDAEATFAGVRVPTLAIYGAWDRWVPIEPSIDVWRAAFADRTDRLTVERIPDAGHMMTSPDDPADLDEVGPISPVYTDVLAGWVAGVAAG
jgi:hypothetical protein